MMGGRSFACRVSGSRDTSGSGSRDTAFLTKSTSVSSSFFGCGSVHATFRCCKLSFRPIVQISNTENILLDPPRGGVPPRARQLSQRVVPGRACHPPRGVAHSRPREPPGGGSAPLRDETSTGPGHEPRKRCASSSTSSTSHVQDGPDHARPERPALLLRHGPQDLPGAGVPAGFAALPAPAAAPVVHVLQQVRGPARVHVLQHGVVVVRQAQLRHRFPGCFTSCMAAERRME